MPDLEFRPDASRPGQRTVIVRGEWRPEYMRPITADGTVDRLLFHPGDSIQTSLDFLPELPQIRVVSIALSSKCDVSVLSRCPFLEEIGIVKWRGDFPDLRHLRNLHTVGIDHGPGALRVLALERLRHLAYGGYPLPDLTGIRGLARLKSLRLTRARLESTRGLKRFTELRWLALVRCSRLQSVVELDTVGGLQKLEVDACRTLPDFREIGRLLQLEELYIQSRGSVASIRPLSRCRSLRRVILSRMTIDDGKVAFLLDLPELTDARVRAAKGYDMSYRQLYERALTRSKDPEEGTHNGGT